MQELYERAKAGDRDALNRILMDSREEMYKIAKTRLRDEEDILDAMQETVISIITNIKKVKKPEYLKTWMIRILINKCNEYHKKSKKEKAIQEKIESMYLIEKEINTEKKIDIEKCIERLKTKERTTLLLYYYSELSTKDISKIMKEPENTIKTRIKRSKNKIKKMLGEHDGKNR